MSILVDANIYLAVILNEPEKIQIINLTQNVDLVSPIVLPFEIGNALSALYKRGKVNKAQLINCYAIFQKIPIRLLDINISNALVIATQYGIYAYDAYYLEVAKRYKYHLLTLDTKMKEIAIDFGIYVMEV